MLKIPLATAMLENLIKLGFTDREAKIYLILLRNGPALASTLAIRTGLKRVSVYSILETLCARGLVSFERTEVGRRYLPHDPECLLYNLEREKAAFQIKWDLAKNCIKSLSDVTVIKRLDVRRVIFLKGVQEIEKAMSELFHNEKKLYGICADTLTLAERNLFKRLFENSNLYYKNCLMLVPNNLVGWMEAQINVSWIEHLFPAEKGQILVQDSSVFFLCEREELELMLIRDPSYAKTVLDVLIKPYDNTSGVLALNSSISFLNG